MSLIKEIVSGLPDDLPVTGIDIGPFDTLAKSRRWGLSSTFRDPCGTTGAAWVRGAGELLGKSVKEIAAFAVSSRLLEASLGMAAINSALDLDGFSFHQMNAADLVLEKGREKRVAVVGNFPFLERLRPQLGELRVIHREPTRAEDGVKEAEAFLPEAEVAAITGSSFITGTAQRLLDLCPRAYIVVLGPTTPFSPILFNYGVDAICGTLVKDPNRALPFVRQGASFRRIEGLELLTAFKEEWGDG